MKQVIVVALVSLWSNLALPAVGEPINLEYYKKFLGVRCSGRIAAHASLYRPAGKAVGRVLQIHGFGDRDGNHPELVDQLVAANYKVLSVDMLGHGQSGGHINLTLYSQMMDYLRFMEEETREPEDYEIPLVVDAWSAFGNLIVRMAEKDAWRYHVQKPIAYVVRTPAITDLSHPFRRATTLGTFGWITDRTITRNREITFGRARPLSPYWTAPGYGGQIFFQSILAAQNDLPADAAPMYVIAGGNDEDTYVDSRGIMKWAERQQSLGRKVWTLKMDGAYHAVDREPHGTGSQVRSRITDFFDRARMGTLDELGPLERVIPLTRVE